MDANWQSSDDFSIAYALLRMTLGVNICMHGTSRLLAGLDKFVGSMMKMFQGTVLPTFLVVPFAYALPWLEAALGFLLIIGLRTREALVLGSLLMVALTFGSALRQDWDAAGIQLLYSVVYCGLIAALRHNRFSVDRLLSPGKGHE
jgi:thiosulfate dehydrogenase [quinone] large subunit